MSIWNQEYKVEDVHAGHIVNMLKLLDIRITTIGEDYLEASMPVDERTTQPYGILHGGATCVLAESVGSIAGNLVLDQERYYAVGMDIQTNHLKSVMDGRIFATAKPLHLGRSSQVWDIRVRDERERLVAVSRLTMAVVRRKEDGTKSHGS